MYDFVSFRFIPKGVKGSLGTTRGRGKGGKKKKKLKNLYELEQKISQVLKHIDY